jgi:hypothetical protein
MANCPTKEGHWYKIIYIHLIYSYLMSILKLLIHKYILHIFEQTKHTFDS